MEYDYNFFIHRIHTFVGIVFVFNLVAYLFEKDMIKPTKFLGAASFFLFATHAPFLMPMFRKINFILFNPQSDWAFTVLFIVNTVLTVFAALGVYYLLKRFLPTFTGIITGGRNN